MNRQYQHGEKVRMRCRGRDGRDMGQRSIKWNADNGKWEVSTRIGLSWELIDEIEWWANLPPLERNMLYADGARHAERITTDPGPFKSSSLAEIKDTLERIATAQKHLLQLITELSKHEARISGLLSLELEKQAPALSSDDVTDRLAARFIVSHSDDEPH